MTTSKLESVITRQVKGWLKNHPDIWHMKVLGSGVQVKGVPDFLICKNGKFVGIELKRPDGKGIVSEVQKAQIDRIRKAGGVAEVIDNFNDFLALMESL